MMGHNIIIIYSFTKTLNIGCILITSESLPITLGWGGWLEGSCMRLPEWEVRDWQREFIVWGKKEKDVRSQKGMTGPLQRNRTQWGGMEETVCSPYCGFLRVGNPKLQLQPPLQFPRGQQPLKLQPQGEPEQGRSPEGDRLGVPASAAKWGKHPLRQTLILMHIFFNSFDFI